MQLPNIPNDNLYKFMAFAGLAIILSTSYLFWTQLREINFEVTEQSGELTQLEKDMKAAERNPELPPSVGPPDDNLAKRLNNLRTQAELLQIRKRELFLLIISMIVGTVVGGFLTIYGSVLWYTRVQRPQDLLLQKQIRDEGRRRPRLRG